MVLEAVSDYIEGARKEFDDLERENEEIIESIRNKNAPMKKREVKK